MANGTEFSKGYGERIKARRLECHLTQDALGKAIGVPKLTVSHWECNRFPPLKYLMPLSQALDVSPSWIMRGPEETLKDIGNLMLAVHDATHPYTGIDTSHRESGPSPPLRIVESPARIKLVPMLGHVAAGAGSVIEPGREEDLVVDFSRRADYVLTVKGESMEPVLPDGAIMFVRRVEVRLPPFETDVPFQVPVKEVAPLAGKIVVVSLNGIGYVKRMQVAALSGGAYECRLESMNRFHNSITVERDDDCRVQGVGIGVYCGL